MDDNIPQFGPGETFLTRAAPLKTAAPLFNPRPSEQVPEQTGPLPTFPNGFGGFSIPTASSNPVPKKESESVKDWILKTYPGVQGRRMLWEGIAESNGNWDAQEKISEADAERNYGVGSRRAKRLGNTQPGDGYKFRGRSFFQLSGRYNYDRITKALQRQGIKVDLVENPDAILDPEIAKLAWPAYLEMKRTQGHDISTPEGLHKAIGPADSLEARKIKMGPNNPYPEE